MFQKIATPLACFGCITAASAQFTFPEFDVARVNTSYSDDMKLEGGPGSLDVTKFEIRTILSKPLTPANGLTILPVFEYKFAEFDFDGVPAGFPINHEELHSLNLSAFAISNCQGSPWVYGAWARAEMASDFQDFGNGDFTFDIAGGVGYRFTDRFTLGFGGALMNLNGDETFYPGIGFDWIVSDQVRIGLYGPTFVAAYTPDDNWEFSVRGDSNGDVWNITDDSGKSRNIDLSSYRLGLFANRRLTGQLWLSAGAGATFGNQLALTQVDGDELYEEDMSSGMFGQISLRLKAW